jgi:cytochrome c-type biogenesis protein CcsB
MYWVVGALIGLGLAALALGLLMRPEPPGADPFAAEVDLKPLDRSALYHRGRLKSFDSFAHEVVRSIAGRAGVSLEGDALPADYAYLDLMIRPELYEDQPIVGIRKKPLRAEMADALLAGGRVTPEWAEAFVESGQISRRLLESPEASALLDRWSRDLVRTAKFVDEIEGSVWWTRTSTLGRMMSVVPPATGDDKTPWISVWDIFPPTMGEMPTTAHELAGMIPEERLGAMRGHWGAFVQAWRDRDADLASGHLRAFCAELPEVAPELYPDSERLGWESFYFQAKYLVWAWIIYLASVILLLMNTAFRWPAARWMGLGVFSVALAIQTGSIALRWYVSGRWPNSNMFEAVTTSVWFGAVVAVVLEIIGRKTPLRNLFAIGAGVASMAAMMTGQFVDKLDPSINNMMPILHDLWLYIHTNTIIASYALIAMAAVTALLYLIRRLGLVVRGTPNRDAEFARVGGTGMLLSGGAEARDRTTMGQVLDGATLVLMELSFVMLWAGIVMGAIWADHSWGRPWGWDPKEVFALNTFIVFLVLIHVRMRVRDKGLWTAWLAVAGCGVMLFNWIVINFIISGLHSYA